MVLYRFVVDESRCMNCGACMDLCPSTALEFTRPGNVSFYGDLFRFKPVDEFEEGEPKVWMMEKPYLPMQERCTGCQICVRECPTNAVSVEPDTSKSPSLRPKPVIVRKGPAGDDDGWRPLSEFTRDYLKRPIRSPWAAISDWKPTIKERGVTQTWRSMEKDS